MTRRSGRNRAPTGFNLSNPGPQPETRVAPPQKVFGRCRDFNIRTMPDGLHEDFKAYCCHNGFTIRAAGITLMKWAAQNDIDLGQEPHQQEAGTGNINLKAVADFTMRNFGAYCAGFGYTQRGAICALMRWAVETDMPLAMARKQ